MERTEKEIEDVIAKAEEQAAEGGAWPGMTYEQGVSAALRWVTGQSDDNPMDD